MAGLAVSADTVRERLDGEMRPHPFAIVDPVAVPRCADRLGQTMVGLRSPIASRTLDEAAAWLARLASGDASASEVDAYLSWRVSRPMNAEAADYLLDVWDLAGLALSNIVREAKPIGSGQPERADVLQLVAARSRGLHIVRSFAAY